jgi:hypothetical protein
LDFDKPPPEIGPHEERELELMLAGVKPLAYFSELTRADFEFPDAEFEPHVKTGRIIKRDILHIQTLLGQNEEIRSLYYALPGEEWRIDKAHANRLRGYQTRKKSDYDSREMGELLGYTKHEIDVFLKWSARLDQARRDGEWNPPRTPA